MKLNEGQQAAVDAVISGFTTAKTKGLTVIGEGGTGKTTSVMYAASELIRAGLKVLFTAPTNKAVKQLEASARKYGHGLNGAAFMTLHKALGLAMLPNEDRKVAVRSGQGALEAFDVIVVDEASMVSKICLQEHLLPQAAANEVAILFMGDDMQLPPVREQKSLAFELFRNLHLTQVERQASDSGIFNLTSPLREAIKTGKLFKLPQIVTGTGVETVTAAEFLKTVVAAFTLDTDLDNQRVLAWRNNRVDEVNTAIRKSLFGKTPARFIVGERMVTGAPIRSDGETLLSTDEECTVSSVTLSSIEDEETGDTYKVYTVVLRPIHADVGQVIANVLHEDGQADYDERLAWLVKQAKSHPAQARYYWKLYHNFMELFANLKYAYCITVHRSQGSTYNTVYVDVADILANNNPAERKNLLYVAFSRPRNLLVVNKKAIVA